jgi:D-cysteine desulfhydrase
MIPYHLPLAHTPTPLWEAERLSSELGVRIRIKRDDLTGSHLSGNKIRKLEFLLADAQAKNATAVLTCGGIQSNHCRATALAAAPLGLRPHLLLRTPHGTSEDLPSPSGANVLLDRLAGAAIRTCTPDAYRRSRSDLLSSWADELRAQGDVPYIVPEGGSNALGSLGYVRAAYELAAQYKDRAASSVVVPTGSGGTLAGLAMGLKAAGLKTKAWGIAVCDDEAYFRAIVDRISSEAAELYGTPRLEKDDYGVIAGYQGRGYALSTAEELMFLKHTAQKDGLVLDPVYTGKAFRGMVDLCQRDASLLGDDVTFIHTGGVFGLFAKAEELDQAWGSAGD